MSSAYNGIIGNPVFATLMATETSGAKNGMLLVGPSLVGGTVGFLFFELMGVPPFAGFLNVGTVTDLSLAWVIWAIGLGLVGALVAIYAAVAFRALGRVMAVFKDRVIERALVAGVVIGAVCYFIPNLMFSGETEIHGIIADRAQYGLPLLLLLRAPLTAILLVSVLVGAGATPAMIGLITVATAASLGVGMLLQRAMARRAEQAQAAQAAAR